MFHYVPVGNLATCCLLTMLICSNHSVCVSLACEFRWHQTTGGFFSLMCHSQLQNIFFSATKKSFTASSNHKVWSFKQQSVVFIMLTNKMCVPQAAWRSCGCAWSSRLQCPCPPRSSLPWIPAGARCRKSWWMGTVFGPVFPLPPKIETTNSRYICSFYIINHPILSSLSIHNTSIFFCDDDAYKSLKTFEHVKTDLTICCKHKLLGSPCPWTPWPCFGTPPTETAPATEQ